MNQYLKIKFADGCYFEREWSNDEMEVLGSFLSSDVGCYWPSFKEWAKEEGDSVTGGNLSYLEKKDNHIIIAYEPHIFGPTTGFKITKQAFIDVLNDWEKVCEEEPPYILITYDGQQFTVEGKTTPLSAELTGDGDAKK